MKVRINSLYICVEDMDRAIRFYEDLFAQKVSEKDDIYSVFQIGSFRFGLFAYAGMKEEHVFGSNCLPSITFPDKKTLLEKIRDKEICFPLTRIGRNWVAEIVDSEGNHIEVTAEIIKTDSKELLANLGRLHTTALSQKRIKDNLDLEEKDITEWCRKKISSKNAKIERKGKNWYIRIDGYVITVNASSYTIITAHREK